MARALAELPRLSAAMRRGALSYSKVRALTRVATPQTEERLLDFARCATAAHVERLVRAWRRVDRIAAAEDDRRRHQSRHLEVWVDDDGMLVVTAQLLVQCHLLRPIPGRSPAQCQAVDALPRAPKSAPA